MSDAMMVNVAGLKQVIVDAKKCGQLTLVESQQCFSAIAKITHLLSGSLANVWRDRELPEYTDWPSQRHPCPKCGDMKPRFRKWRRETAHAPERVEHSCFCDYSITTKPLDMTVEAEYPTELRSESDANSPNADSSNV